MNSLKKPMLFSSLPLSSSLVSVVGELGFTSMTPIQSESIPLLLQGRDLIGKAQTGSGKTAAFALPVLQKVEAQILAGTPKLEALILCPTRELCDQVAREFRRLGRKIPGLHIGILSGGQPVFPQAQALQKGVHIAVGTPGRVLDHLSRTTLDLTSLSTLILDEADRMLDMGFEDDMREILSAMPDERQTVFFSATFPTSIERLSAKYQRSPVQVSVETSNQIVSAEPEKGIEQWMVEKNADLTGYNDDWKWQALLNALVAQKPDTAIIFCNLKATVHELASDLKRAGVSADALHGDLDQRDRDRVMAMFRNQSLRVLVATDVAARGIDVGSLDCVVNFDLPSQPENYVHRIGRTGRAGRAGYALALVDSKRDSYKKEMIEQLTGVKLRSLEFDGEIQSDDERVKALSAKMKTLFLGAGRKEKLRPGDILGALTGDAGGFVSAQIGKIEIHDHFAYVAVAREIAKEALNCLQNGRIKGRKIRVEWVH